MKQYNNFENQKYSLKEDIEHYRSNLNNKKNISEHTDNNYSGNYKTQNNIPTKVNDHKYNQPAKTKNKKTSVRSLLKIYRINKQIIHRTMKQ